MEQDQPAREARRVEVAARWRRAAQARVDGRRGVAQAAGRRRSAIALALQARREALRATLPIGRVVGPADVAAPAVHLMINTAVTGATYDIDGGRRLIA